MTVDINCRPVLMNEFSPECLTFMALHIDCSLIFSVSYQDITLQLCILVTYKILIRNFKYKIYYQILCNVSSKINIIKFWLKNSEGFSLHSS